MEHTSRRIFRQTLHRVLQRREAVRSRGRDVYRRRWRRRLDQSRQRHSFRRLRFRRQAMTDEAAQFYTISLPNPHSSECASSRERQKTEASKRLRILNKKIEKRMKHIVPIIAVATGLTLAGLTPLFAEEEDEQVIGLSDNPAAVQKTFNDEAAGGKIVRVEKEENNY